MADLGLQVSGVLTSFVLQNFAVEKTIKVWVDDVRVAKGDVDGWTYDEDYHIVYFHGAAIPARGATIDISYEIGAPG